MLVDADMRKVLAAMPTVPAPAWPQPSSMADSSSVTATLENRVIGGPAGQQRFLSGAAPVVVGSAMFQRADAPLAQVAFAPFDATHRTFQNLFHRPAPTDDATPRPDWNVFATLQNWPMKAVAGLRTTIFGGPQSPRPTGKP
jgi:hypothetical protein